jgi:hypothetical protein
MRPPTLLGESMNCQLPTTGGGSLGIVVIALLLVATGVGVLLVTRHPGARTVLPVLVLLAAAFGVTANRPAAAATDCPPTTVAATAAPITEVTSTTVAPTSTTTTSPTTTTTTTVVPSTTIGPVRQCHTLLQRDGDFEQTIDVLITIDNGVGTFTASFPSTGACDGAPQASGLVVDSNVFEPIAYCAANLPGSQAFPAASAGVWTPPIPPGLYACVPQDNPPDTTTTLPEPPTTEESTATTEESTATTEESTATTEESTATTEESTATTEESTTTTDAVTATTLAN